MKKLLAICVAILAATTFVSAKRQKPDDILNEGKHLYRLERASWYGTDAFLEMCPEKVEQIGGQLSYLDEAGRAVNIFYKKNDTSHILARIRFDSPMYTIPSAVDTLNVVASPEEQILIEMRENTKKALNKNEDAFFSFYENTSINLIPVIANGRRNVFIVTAPHDQRVVLLGNDYKLTYDKKNRLKKREQLHKSLIKLEGTSNGPLNSTSISMHSHVLSDLITSTDICTLLLYRDRVRWKQHLVFGKKHVSILDMNTESLEIMKTEAFKEKVNEQRHGSGSKEDPAGL